MLAFHPREAIVPICGRRDPQVAGHVDAFLGTGSLIGDGSILLTAHHVIAPWTADLAIAVPPKVTTLYPISVISTDPLHDLALLRVDGYKAPRPLIPRFDESVVELQRKLTNRPSLVSKLDSR